MRIAIIEDDPDIGAVVRQWLESAGHFCHLFGTGKGAQREIARESFDLFLIDWQLPDTSGDAVLRYIRETIKYWVPVIFVTSRDSPSGISGSSSCGGLGSTVRWRCTSSAGSSTSNGRRRVSIS